MRFFPLLRKKEFFSADEQQRIIEAIRLAEEKTSGEIRLYVESRCRYVDPLDRAAELFWSLQMDRTADHNAVLLYIAVKDHQVAIFADNGIHEKVGTEFWKKEVTKMVRHFRERHYVDAIVQVVQDIGAALYLHFPYIRQTDKNELPDDLVFGR